MSFSEKRCRSPPALDYTKEQKSKLLYAPLLLSAHVTVVDKFVAKPEMRSGGENPSSDDNIKKKSSQGKLLEKALQTV